MEKEFVPYEQALALVLLGYTEYSELYKDDKEELFDMRTPNDAPCILYQQAFRWFRDKYGIMHRITSYAFGYQIHLDNTPEPKFWNTDRRFDSDVDYKVYEEAELACLKKLIEIVKQK